jgi:hypothetical protein
MLAKLLFIASVASLFFTGCDRKRLNAKALESNSAPTPAMDGGENAGNLVETAEESPQLSPEAIESLLDGWLRSQNEGRFEEYRSLYATRFAGIKRVGTRVFKFDREGWLKDRERMFNTKMNVSLADVRITTTATTGNIEFVQTWASGEFRDRGPKRIFLLTEGEKLKIGSEEMIASKILSAENEVIPLAPSAAALVIENSFYVLSGGQPDIPMPDEAFTIERGRSAFSPVPERFAKTQKLGDLYSLYGPVGKVCDGKIVGVYTVGRIQPHFSQTQEWGSTPKPGMTSDHDVAHDVMRLAGQEGTVLAARIHPLASQNCRGAQWGQPTPKPGSEPVIFRRPRSPNAVATSMVTRALQTTPGYMEIQSQFEESGHTGPWHKHEPQISIHFFGPPKNGYGSIHVRSGIGCGEFYGEFWALYRLVGDQVVLLTDSVNPGTPFLAEAVADVDGDGDAEFFGTSGVVRKSGAVWRVTNPVGRPDYDCSC